MRSNPVSIVTVLGLVAAALAPSMPVADAMDGPYRCEVLVPSDGTIVTCPSAPLGSYQIACSGTWSHATWVAGAITDCAWSGEPSAAWGSSCALHPSSAAIGGHGIRLNGKQPFHANVTLEGVGVAFIDVQGGRVIASSDVRCDWSAHVYNATFHCASGPCPLQFRIFDTDGPGDYGDNAGSLRVVVSTLTDAIPDELTGLRHAVVDEAFRARAHSTREHASTRGAVLDDGGVTRGLVSSVSASLHSAITSLSHDIEAGFASMESGLADLRSRLDSGFGGLAARLDTLELEMHARFDGLTSLVTSRLDDLGSRVTSGFSNMEGQVNRRGDRIESLVNTTSVVILDGVEDVQRTLNVSALSAPLGIALSASHSARETGAGDVGVLVTLEGRPIAADVWVTLGGESTTNATVEAAGEPGLYVVRLKPGAATSNATLLVVRARSGSHEGSALERVGSGAGAVAEAGASEETAALVRATTPPTPGAAVETVLVDETVPVQPVDAETPGVALDLVRLDGEPAGAGRYRVRLSLPGGQGADLTLITGPLEVPEQQLALLQVAPATLHAPGATVRVVVAFRHDPSAFLCGPPPSSHCPAAPFDATRPLWLGTPGAGSAALVVTAELARDGEIVESRSVEIPVAGQILGWAMATA